MTPNRTKPNQLPTTEISTKLYKEMRKMCINTLRSDILKMKLTGYHPGKIRTKQQILDELL